MTLVLEQTTTVAVVGAGLAGLTAARRLRDAGAEVTVLEARDRVGGRTFTERPGFEGDQHCDLGAELIDSSYHALSMLCAELGVELSDPISYEREDVATGDTPLEGYLEPGRLIVDGELLDGDTFDAVKDEISAALASAPPALHEPVDQWTRRARLSTSARGAVRAIARMPAQVDVHELDGHFLFGDAHLTAVRRIVGGTQRLADALANGLDVRFGDAVLKVRQRGGMVDVITENGLEVRADRVVVAIPLFVLPSIGFTPPLPDSRLAALHAFRPAVGGKVIGQYLEGDRVRAALSRAVFTSGPLNTAWVSNPYVTDGPAVVVGFLCGEARAHLESPEGALALLDGVVETAVGGPVTRIGHTIKDWTSDPHALAMGATPGHSLRGALVARVVAPERRVHFAGDYTDVALCGTMEGAIRSGLRAADEVLRRPVRMSLADIESRLVRP